jgi:hypothetical protein
MRSHGNWGEEKYLIEIGQRTERQGNATVRTRNCLEGVGAA